VKALQAIFGRCGAIAPILARDRTGNCLQLLLQLLSPCIVSEVVDIALWACRILARAGEHPSYNPPQSCMRGVLCIE
jgi:hypothetical protein